MKNTYTFLFFVLITFAIQAQYNENAPWVQNQENVAKSSEQTIQTLTNNFNAYFKDKDWQAKGSGYKPFKRWENHWKHYTIKGGYIAPPTMLWDAWEQKNEIAKKFSDGGDWSSLGPYTTNVKDGQGRINTFIVDPNNANTFYVGAPSGGIWKSTDAGKNWRPLSDNLPQIGVSGIAIDPNNSNIIYISTGDDDANDSYSIGVMKSTDGGSTWNKTGLEFTDPYSSSNEIYIHPNNSNILWVATSNGIYKTTDAGGKWKNMQEGNFGDLKLKPGDPNTLYAVTSKNFYKSTNGGDSFTQITDNLPTTSSRMVIDVTAANPSALYVLCAKSDYSFEGLYKSTDSGDTFIKTAETDDIFVSKQAWYDLALTVSPTNEKIIYVGVLDIWKSTDGGNNFSQINRWWNSEDPSYTHADIHFMRYFNNKLYAGTDGGIYQSANEGASFKDLTETLNISQYYKIATAKNSAKNIAGGLQDNGGFGYSNDIWHKYHGGDGMDCAIDPNNENTYYGFTQYGGSLNVTYNGGGNGSRVTSAPADEVSDTDSGGNWVTPLLANKDGELFAGYKKLYKLKSGNWEAVSDDVFGGDLDNIEISTTNNDLVYVSKSDRIFKSEDGGLNFTTLTTSFIGKITSIEINNSDNNIVYLTLGGFYNNNVYKSINGGANWTSIDLNLPNEPKFIIRHQNQSPDNDLYVGTSLGVYHINDEMTEWEVFSKGLPNVPVKDIEINVNEKIITAGTYGRGVWQSPIEVKKAGDDVSLLSILSNNSIQCGDFKPVILVKNNGLNTISVIDINYSIDGENFTHQYTGNISSDNNKEITLPANNSLSPGEHEMVVETTITNDAFIENNELKAKFTINNSGQGQYVNTFGDVNPDRWQVKTIGGSDDLWQKGKATTPVFKDLSESAYITNLAGNYFDNSFSYLISPCYNLASLENPVLRFDMAFNIELDWDVLYIEYTVDKGISWSILGSASDPNWYNSSYHSIERPITVGKQWTGTDLSLKEYSYNLAALNNESNIVFRFVFASDQASNEEGVLIDNFTIDATAILAVNEYEKNSLKVYPNPSNGNIFINRQSTQEMQVTVYDITGKLVYKKRNITDNNFYLNLTNLETGLYFLKINEGNNQVSKKIIIGK